MAHIPRPQEIYRHFKGNLYQVLTLAVHSETEEQLVIYQALYGDYRIFARELSMFTGLVDRKKYPDAKQIYRFELVGAQQADGETEPGDVQDKQAGGGAQQQAAPEAAMEQAAGQADTSMQAAAQAEEHNGIDPLVWEFLDADTYTKRLQILGALHHRITDDMITTMAIACDIEVGKGDIEARYESLKSCLSMLEHYECKRLR